MWSWHGGKRKLSSWNTQHVKNISRGTKIVTWPHVLGKIHGWDVVRIPLIRSLLLFRFHTVIYFWDSADFASLFFRFLTAAAAMLLPRFFFFLFPPLFIGTFKAISGTASGRCHLNFKGLTEHVASISRAQVLSTNGHLQSESSRTLLPHGHGKGERDRKRGQEERTGSVMLSWCWHHRFKLLRRKVEWILKETSVSVPEQCTCVSMVSRP